MEQIKAKLTEHEGEIEKLKNDMNEFKSDLRLGTQIMQTISDDLSVLSKCFREHMNKEDSRIFQFMCFLIVACGGGCVGLAIYIFQNMVQING
jgi:hemerythrin-like domain-containing protein